MFSYWITSNGLKENTHSWETETRRIQEDERRRTDLAPNQHCTEDDLEAIEEVIPYDDNCSAPRGPPLTGADGFNAGSCSWNKERVDFRQK